MGAGDCFAHIPLALEINTYGHFQISVVVAQVKKTPGTCHHGAAQEQTVELHGNGLSPDRMFLCVQGQSHHKCIEEVGGGRVKGNVVASILDLDIAQTELRGTPVRIGFCIFS